MIKEFDTVALNEDLPGTGLYAGTEGAVVMVYNDGEAYEVEFFSFEGETIAVETVDAYKLHQINHNERNKFAY